jgi:hypothetical protein
MNTRALWLRILIIMGSLAMRVSALDPLAEALGTLLGSSERRLFACHTVAFILIALSRTLLLHALALAR